MVLYLVHVTIWHDSKLLHLIILFPPFACQQLSTVSITGIEKYEKVNIKNFPGYVSSLIMELDLQSSEILLWVLWNHL